MKKTLWTSLVIVCVTIATRSSGTSVDDLVKQGNNLCDRQMYREAITVYDRSIKLQKRAEAYYGKGVCHSWLHENKKAIEDYSSAIALNKNWAKPYCARGHAYNFLGQNDRAIDDYSKAIALNPKDETAFAGRANSYNALNRKKEALIDGNRAIELNPEFGKCYSTRGISHLFLHHYPEAVEDFTKSISLVPSVVEREYGVRGAYGWRGLAYYEMGEYAKALADLDKAIALNPKIASNYADRSRCYDKLGKRDLAAKDRGMVERLRNNKSSS